MNFARCGRGRSSSREERAEGEGGLVSHIFCSLGQEAPPFCVVAVPEGLFGMKRHVFGDWLDCGLAKALSGFAYGHRSDGRLSLQVLYTNRFDIEMV